MIFQFDWIDRFDEQVISGSSVEPTIITTIMYMYRGNSLGNSLGE